MRIFLTLIVSLILITVIIFAVGYRSDKSYQETKSALYNDKVENVWKVLTTVESYSIKKKDLEKVEVLDKTFGSIRAWREIYKNGDIREFEILSKNEPNFFVVEMIEPKKQRQGVWEYYLEKEGSRTKINITETSNINSVFWRGVITIFGRDNYTDSEFKWIRVSLFNNLLN